MADRIEPFVIGVEEAALDELRQRLRGARWPELTGTGASSARLYWEHRPGHSVVHHCPQLRPSASISPEMACQGVSAG